MKKRLQVILAHSGVASRRKAAQIIEEGKVWVNNRCVKEKGFATDPDRDTITVNGAPLKSKTRKIYLILNKPKGVVTTAKDEKGRPTVVDLIDTKGSRVYPVGRLDKDTEGLILLTNDGELSYRLTHPRFGVKKIYKAEVKGKFSEGLLKTLENGIFLDGKKTSRSKISVMRKTPNKTILRIELHEGRKRQIRRMIEKTGGSVINLKRIEYAGIKIDNLPKGQYRYLTGIEIKRLKRGN